MILAWPKILAPFFGWAGELRNPQTIKGDNIAGITVALRPSLRPGRRGLGLRRACTPPWGGGLNARLASGYLRR